MAVTVRIFLLMGLLIGVTEQSSYSLTSSKSSFLQIKPQSWTSGSPVQQVSFRFKTHKPNGLLVFIRDGAVAVRLTDGHIDVSTSAGGTSSFQDSQYLADNQWHTIQLDRETPPKTLKMNLDGRGQVLLATDLNYLAENTDLYFGGIDKETLPDVKLAAWFEGCIDQIKLRALQEKDQRDGTWEEAVPTKQSVTEGCQDLCLTDNPCLNGGHCRHHLDGVTCDCSLTAYEGSDCSLQETSIVSLNGVQYISYDDSKAAQSARSTRIAFQFKTHFTEGLLLLADIKGQSSVDQSATLATISILGKYLHVVISTPDQGLPSEPLLFNEAEMDDGQWHSLVLQLQSTHIAVTLDSHQKEIAAPLGRTFGHFDARVTLGGTGPRHSFAAPFENEVGSAAAHSPMHDLFVGCLRRIYYGSTNVLQELKHPEKHTTTLHDTTISSSYERSDILSNECSAVTKQDLSVTLLSEDSSATIPSSDDSQTIDIKLAFRLPPSDSSSLPATLISADLQTQFGSGDFKVVVSNGLILDFNYPDVTGAQQQFRMDQPIGGALADGNWHTLHLKWPAQQDSRLRRQDTGSDDSLSTQAINNSSLDGVDDSSTVDGSVIDNSLPTESVTSTEEVTDASSTEDTTISVAVTEGGEEVPAINRLRMQAPASRDPNSVYTIPTGVDKRSTLIIEVDGTAIEVYPGSTSVSTRGALVIGKRNGNVGFQGCVRDIRDHDNALDIRSLLTASASGGITLSRCGESSQSCQTNNPCEHGAPCRAGITGLLCNCADTGYTGRTCHIPIYAETCTDLFLAGERRSGVHLIDLDGSGPMKPAYVYCNMNISTGDEGLTTITHNFQPATLKSAKVGGVKYEVRYRQFDKASLHKLVDISQQCRQFISYTCRNAPLKLGTHTWFRSIADKGDITSFGSNTPGKCNCAVRGTACGLGARRDLFCNCDADDYIDRVDEGFIEGKDFVGITNMTFINRPIGGSGQVTLGPLECSGKGLLERTVSFMSHAGSLSFPSLGNNEDITFFFKTSLKNAVLLYQPGVTGSSSVNSFRIAVNNASTVVLYISVNGEIRQLPVTVGKALNNGAWHLIKVQYGSNELRFTVDLNHNYLAWGAGDKVGHYKGQLHVGGYPNSADVPQAEQGLIGCIKGLFRGSQSVDVVAAIETSGSTEIRRDCPSSCDSRPCQNGAECFEKFGDYECICANPLAQSGKTCDIDINHDTAVTFETASTSYLLIKTLEVDVFNQDILFSFRTHAAAGILLYAHDNLHNFVQLHLEEAGDIIFTFNNGDKIKTVSVSYNNFNDGKWHQIHVERSAVNTTLTVDYRHSETIEHPEGLVPLSSYNGRPFGISSREKIVPARPGYAIMPFKNMYVGGVATPQIRSTIPGFYGCLRGLKIGSKLYQLMREPDTDITPGVVEGCNAVCESSSPCKNTGRCINNWGNMTNPAECDCAGTSYVGDICSEDIGGNLDGSSQLIVEYKAGHAGSRALDLSQKLSFTLAFSSSVTPSQDVALLFVQAYQKLVELVIGLTATGQVSVDLLTDETTASVHETIEGNFTDGQRHYVTVQTSANKLIFQVDGKRKEVQISLLPAFVHLTSIGGIAIPVKHVTRLGSFVNYSGCISNVRIEVPEKSTISPLEPLKTGLRHQIAPFIATRFTGAVLEEAKCALPAVLVLPTGLLDSEAMDTNLSFPFWDAPPAAAIEYASETAKPAPPAPLERNTAIIVGVICGIFLLAVLIAVLIYIRRIRNNKKNKYTPTEVEEDLPARDALLMRHEPVDDEAVALTQRQKLKSKSNEPFVRPVTNYIDETIIPANSRARLQLEKRLEGSNGLTIDDQGQK